MIKVLNLYAGIGGNRKLWPKECKVTAVENDLGIAEIYKNYFPEDIVIVADAHQYLLDHYKEYDFIWSSPPCPSHSRARYWASKGGKCDTIYPDMKLYQEIIFLTNFCKCKWVVENVIGYYEPLVKAKKVSGHYFWSNFNVISFKEKRENINNVISSTARYGFSIKNVKINHRKDAILRNLINPKLGLHIFDCAFKEKQVTLIGE